MYQTIRMRCSEELSEILQALLGSLGFDAFLEHPDGFEASIPLDEFDAQALQDTLEPFEGQIDYQLEEQEKQNWNKLWESNYEPAIITDELVIRASFHQMPRPYKYEIVITPKMSFGTGHHATTSLMLQNEMSLDFAGKNVADLGCGTGILAVMAKLLGAARVDACDIEDWAVENAQENAQINGVEVNVTLGTVRDMPRLPVYDIVLANINRNVLLEEMALYTSMLEQGGYLLLSGFYTEDLADIRLSAEAQGMVYQSHKEKDRWVSAIFIKG